MQPNNKSRITINLNKNERANNHTIEGRRNMLNRNDYESPYDVSTQQLTNRPISINDRPDRYSHPTRRILISPPPPKTSSNFLDNSLKFPRSISSRSANTLTRPDASSLSISSPKLKRALLRLIPGSADHESLYWLFTGSSAELELLDSEVDKYNYWIYNILGAGLAPLSSYKNEYIDNTILNTMLVAKNKTYKPFLKTDNQIYYTDNWEIIYIDEIEKNPEDEMEPIIADYLAGEIVTQNFQTLEDIIEKPWSVGMKFSMGYRVLPMFRRLIIKQNK
jgi:hypothetical protein